MTSIATRLKVGTAAGAIAVATSLTSVAPAEAAPVVPVPAAPVQVLDVPQGPFSFFGGGVDLLALLNNNGTQTMSTHWNPGQFLFGLIAKIHTFIAVLCYKHFG